MHTKSISELLLALQQGEFSARELTSHFLDRIDALEPHYNSFITLLQEQALQAATRSDQLRAKGEAQPLSGIPIVHKDIFCTKGIRTTCGSRILHDFVSPYDATVVEKLNQAGVIVLGKTNMDEFAMGSSSETSYYGNVHNPWDLQRVPGGSSGGSAVAVAARLCVAATGSDTGGSIRQPAALCGITGFKPTYGRISRWGMIAYASSLDQAGTLTRSAEDAALLLSAMAGHDHKDSTSIAANVPDYAAELGGKTSGQRSVGQPLGGLRIGLCKEYFEDGLDAAVAVCVQEGVAELEKLGATVSEVSLANIKQAIPAYYVIAPAECSANLARYDGVRFGYRCENPVNLEDLYKRSRSEGFGREVKRRIMIGTFVLSAGYYEAYYRKAQQIRRLIKNDFSSAFDQVDILVGPTTPTPAFKIGAISEDQIAMYLQDIFTIACNLAGLPAASIPVGFVDGLPVGMQLIGNYLQEATILRVAHQFQLQTDWHGRLPATAA